MRDWDEYVRRQLSLPDLARGRELRIVRELASQLEDFHRDAVARGMTETEADAHARSQITDWKRLADTLRSVERPHTPSYADRWSTRLEARAFDRQGRWLMFHDIWQDVRHAIRRLRAQPGFTAVAVLTLALAAGATTAIFSVVYGVLLKPLPFTEPERLVGVHHRSEALGLAVMNQGPATYFTYRDHQRVFEEIGAWESNEVSITGRGDPERLEVLSVTESTLRVLGVQPALGRLFDGRDDVPGSPLRVVLTWGYWHRRFGGAPDVLGRPLRIDGETGEIVGVLPSSFRFLDTSPQLVIPMRLQRAEFVMFDFQAVARLKPGVTLPQANADIGRMIPLLPEGHDRLKLQPNVRPLAEDVTGDIGNVLWTLLAAVGVVLLIACANVASLLLVRAEGRRQELAMRAALGASRGRIARGMLAEALALALAGGALGVAFAQGAIGLLRRLAPEGLPRVDEIGIDPPVLLFAVALSLLAGALLGLVPVLRLGAPTAAALKESSRSASEARGPLRTRHALVVTEVALAVVLVIVSGLMIRTFLALRQVHPGFTRPQEVQTFQIAMPEQPEDDGLRFARTHEQIARRLAQVPGVVSVGLSSSITMDGEDNTNPLFVEHVEVPDGRLPPLRRFKTVAPGYFETMGNPVVAGRPITWTDIEQRRPVVVISETLAREYWQTPANAIGKRVRGFRPNWYDVVGVVGEERDDGLNHPPTAIVYWPLVNEVYYRTQVSYAVRSTRVGSPGFVAELRRAVWSVDPALPLAGVQTLDAIRSRSMAQTSFAMVMLAIAGSVALLLGAVGIYGVIAYITARRTREIGIRMALGAQAADVGRLVLGHGMVLAGTGIVIGLVAALVVTRLIRALLYDTSPTDPLTFAAVVPLLGAAALLACWVPARRAMRADPVVALRCE